MDVDVSTNIIARTKLPYVETFETSIPATQFLRSLMSGPDETRETTANDVILWPALHTALFPRVSRPDAAPCPDHLAESEAACPAQRGRIRTIFHSRHLQRCFLPPNLYCGFHRGGWDKIPMNEASDVHVDCCNIGS